MSRWRELSRRALDYDMIKTYVRLPADRMRTVIEAAHELGSLGVALPVPGAHLGQDGTTHLAATSVSATRTLTATATSYGDVVALRKGERSVTATLFTTEFLGRGDQRHPRLALYPSHARTCSPTPVTTPPPDPDCDSADCREVWPCGRRRGGWPRGRGHRRPLARGAGLHANLRNSSATAGPVRALRTATVNAAENLGVAEDVGTLEPGKVADLVLVRGNPLRDIDAAMNVEATMVGGHLYTLDELLGPYTGGHGATTAAAATGEEAAPAPATVVSEWADPKVGARYWWHAPEVVAADHAHSCSAYDRPGR